MQRKLTRRLIALCGLTAIIGATMLIYSNSNPDMRGKPAQNHLKYVGNIRSKKYHDYVSRELDRIPKEELTNFYTLAEAESAGFTPCGNCLPELFKKYILTRQNIEGNN